MHCFRWPFTVALASCPPCACASVEVEPGNHSTQASTPANQPDYGLIVTLDITDSVPDGDDLPSLTRQWLGKTCTKHLDCNDEGGTGHCTKLDPNSSIRGGGVCCPDGCKGALGKVCGAPTPDANGICYGSK